jgi:hypothetical protein
MLREILIGVICFAAGVWFGLAVLACATLSRRPVEHL